MAVQVFSSNQLGFPFTFIKAVREKINEIITASKGILQDKQTATGNTVTLNTSKGAVTSASLTTAAGASQDITVNNTEVEAGSVVLSNLSYTGNGIPVLNVTTVSDGQVVFTVTNLAGAAALNAAVTINYIVI